MPVEGREAKRGARATSYRQRYRAEREYERAVKDGQPWPASREPDREVLERAVRLSAAASASEGEFVRRLRAEGLIVRPRFAAGREDQVVGYSVALTPAEGQRGGAARRRDAREGPDAAAVAVRRRLERE